MEEFYEHPTINNHNSNNAFKIKGAATRAKARHENAENHVAPDSCTICLDPITERAIAFPCNHLTFDFLCLVSWLQERTTCPLCKAKVTEVQYDWRSPEDFKTYHVPDIQQPQESNSRRRPQVQARRPRRARTPSRAEIALASSVEEPVLARRRNVYRERWCSLYVGSNHVSRYKDFTAHDFANSTVLQSRARLFLRRELQVFTFLTSAPSSGNGTNRDYLIEYIVAILKQHELRGANGQVEDLLQEFLGRENTRLLLHELEAWLRSPYSTLREWDRHVQYADHGQRQKRNID